MAFDGTHWEPPPPQPPVRRGETLACIVMVVLAVGMMLLPISLVTVGDLVHYLLHKG